MYFFNASNATNNETNTTSGDCDCEDESHKSFLLGIMYGMSFVGISLILAYLAVNNRQQNTRVHAFRTNP